MNYQNKVFQNKRIELRGNTYHHCTFNNCELVYDGDRSPTFHDNEFIDTVFTFTGSALRTLYFLGNMYHAGEGGKEVIDKTLEDIKNRKIHGHETTTIKPHTTDHSLSSELLQ